MISAKYICTCGYAGEILNGSWICYNDSCGSRRYKLKPDYVNSLTLEEKLNLLLEELLLDPRST